MAVCHASRISRVTHQASPTPSIRQRQFRVFLAPGGDVGGAPLCFGLDLGGGAQPRRVTLAFRTLPASHLCAGDLFAIVQVVVPTVLDEREKRLFEELAEVSRFDPRSNFGRGGGAGQGSGST